MKKILSTTAIAGSLCLLGTSTFAQFSGFNLALGGSMAGVEVSASKSNTSDNSPASGNFGMLTAIPELEASYSFAVDKSVSIGLGGTYNLATMNGVSANYTQVAGIKSGGTATGGTSRGKLDIKDAYSIFLMPTFQINKDVAAFIKGGYTHADLNVSSTITSQQGTAVTLSSRPSKMDGWMYGIGIKTFLTKDVFMQTEATVTDWDTISGTTSDSTTYNANLKLVQGTVKFGMKF